jgi:hypothetical protein
VIDDVRQKSGVAIKKTGHKVRFFCLNPLQRQWQATPAITVAGI